MDVIWLDKNSFLERGEIREFLVSLTLRHFNNGYEWMGAAADKFSDLAPTARDIFWEELDKYAKEHSNFRIEYVHDEINQKLKEYPLLPVDPKRASEQVFSELRSLHERFIYNAKCDTDNFNSLSIDGFYFEVRWILGQILSTFPDILDKAEYEAEELPKKYNDFDTAYHVVEFLLKTLGDMHIQDFYTGYYPLSFAVQLESILKEKH